MSGVINSGEELALEIAHAVRNTLTQISSEAQLLLYYRKDILDQLPPETKEVITTYLLKAVDASESIVQLMNTLTGSHQALSEGIEYVKANTLGPNELVYRIVHVDDSVELRVILKEFLNGSNLIPPSLGFFGHDGRKIKYEVHSYKSVDEALAGIHATLPTEPIHLLLTDREMPSRDGLLLLEELSMPEDKTVRKAEYRHIERVAMLTGGIAPEHAAQITQTYGAPVLHKPIGRGIEQQIYRIINPVTIQS